MSNMLLEMDQETKSKILDCIMKYPDVILLLKEKYVNEEIWRFCIEQEPNIFKNMKHPSEAICNFACEIDGENLRYVINKFSYVPVTDEMIFNAVNSNPRAINYVPKKKMTEYLKELAFDKDLSLMLNFKNVRTEYLKRKLKEKPSNIKFMLHLEELTEDLICQYILVDPNICVYINKMTPRMLSLLEENYPSYYQLFKNSFGSYLNNNNKNI